MSSPVATVSSSAAYPSSATFRAVTQGVEARPAKEFIAAGTTEGSAATPGQVAASSSASAGQQKDRGQSALDVAEGAAGSAPDVTEVPFDAASDRATGVVNAVLTRSFETLP
jgi:hypothetical protein